MLFLVAGQWKALGSMTLLSGLPPLDKAELRGESPITLELKNRIICGNDPVNRHDPLGLWDGREATEELLKKFGKRAVTSGGLVGGVTAVEAVAFGGIAALGAPIVVGAYQGMKRDARTATFAYSDMKSSHERAVFNVDHFGNPDGPGGPMIIPTPPYTYDGEFVDVNGDIRRWEDGRLVRSRSGTGLSDEERRALANNYPVGMDGFASAKTVHDRYLLQVRPGARERVFDTRWSKNKGLGSRKFDDFDDLTGTGFEANTTPWSRMTREQLSRKLDQAGSDSALLKTNPQVRRIIWFGTEELPSSGLGGQLKQALMDAGIPYWVIKP
jgi:hypothetical protein